MDHAVSWFERARQSDPSWEDPVAALASVLERQSRLEEGQALLQPLIDRQSEKTNTVLTYARIARRRGALNDAAGALERLTSGTAARQALSGIEREALYFELGSLYDAAGNYDAAFDAFRQANTARMHHYDPRAHEASVETLIGMFPRRETAAFSHADSPLLKKVTPIFVVGMPRSGTSLVHETLSAHPSVHSVGESPLVDALARHLLEQTRVTCAGEDWPGRLGKGVLNRLSEVYIDAALQGQAAAPEAPAAPTAPAAPRTVVDKMPGNLFHLGFVQLLWPNARVIYCDRDPRDSCLSCYFQPFGPGHPYSFDLAHLGHYHKQIARLMEHWRETLDIPILTWSYEAFVADHEAKTRELVAFAGLPWHPHCLQHHKAEPKSYTASYAQIRQPVHRRSVGRHKFYAEHIGTLLSALSPESDNAAAKSTAK